MNYISTKRIGYSQDESGFSGAFSWWRNSNNWYVWSVCGHSQFSKDGIAVTDDFGTLVEVKQ